MALRDARVAARAETGHDIDFRFSPGARLAFADGTPDAGWGVAGALQVEYGGAEDRARDVAAAERAWGKAKELMADPTIRLLILDEPTSALTTSEIAVLLDIIRDLKAQGVACVYISHKLEEVAAICDTIVVIRDGIGPA